MIKACLFDLDGTLLDTLSTISYYGNMALNKFGIDSIETNEYKYFVGNGAKLLVERMLKFRNAYTEEMFDQVFKYYNEQYNADVKRYTEPYNGVEKLVKDLKSNGILTAVISNKPDYAACEAVNTFFEDGSFDVVHGQREGIKIKPDPEGAADILKTLGVKPEETVYVGDTWIDMQTGKNLGAYTIGVLWGFRDFDELESNGADKIISTPNEIFEYIKSVNKTK